MMKKILNNFDKVFLIFLYLQPFLDISNGLFLHFGYNLTISSLIRFIFMFFCIIYLLFYVKNKRINIYLLLLAIYFSFFTITILISKDISVLTYELKNLLTTYYFVILLLSLLSLYKNKKFNCKNLFILYFIYLILVFIPNIFNIGFDSYWHSKLGTVGWFVSANVVGSILSILLPLLFVYFKKINITVIVLLFINLYVILSIGTKVPVLSFILIFIINFIYYIINLIRKKDYKKLKIIIAPIIIVFIATIIILPKTSFYKNLVIHFNYLQEKDDGNIPITEFVDHFIFSQRLTFEEKTRKAYNNSTMLEKMFGIGYIENYNTKNERKKTIEIDYFDILYRHGIIGFIIFFAPLIYLLKNKIKTFKNINFLKLNISLSLMLIFLLALFQGHIFVTPANSIYVALILALIYNNAFQFKNEPKSK